MSTIGQYLAERLITVGIRDYFAVPGDYNLVLLDEVLTNKSLNMINCCNELNASYAADGYARVNGISACFVTFGVGGLSAINGIAGAYAENLPVIIISGAPNSNSIQRREVVHHTTGTNDHAYIRRMFQEVCCHTECIISPDHAPLQIDNALYQAVTQSKPVYIDISCNISNSQIAEASPRNFQKVDLNDNISQQEASEAIANRINQANKPIFVIGSGCRERKISDTIAKLSLDTGIAFTTMPDAKGFISEKHPNYIGHYWGPVSCENVCEIVESSDCYIFVGANINDYTTAGYRNNISQKNLIQIKRTNTTIGDTTYTRAHVEDVLTALDKKLKPNRTALEQFNKINKKNTTVDQNNPSNESVSREYLVKSIQSMLTEKNLVLVETGDAWFNGLDLKLPENCQFEIQMQYGSIGWSVGATLGAQVALNNKKRVIALIGDGSFQMTAQELSTIIRYRLTPIIFLVNNASYGIEVQIHDGPYNVINNWSYAKLVDVFRGGNMDAKSVCVTTEAELSNAIEEAEKTEALYFIEVKLDLNDCNKKLLQWGKYVAEYNSRKPKD
jgi:pyruvate decarboxylase